ncbi:hypothetical protein INS49_011980 [Diaporthe citri]|uniref:uncharacterized protein n=1 Tax=Diaporthe citri TaxID=83186 RepID=UPI001C7F8650|nr:uncharacterized protein INS49_011980 [Diaporthe citri]KAG6360912.1 hypothetical protein INS49_011980 [Diaporthe citri]
MPVPILNYLQHFTADEQRSTHDTRVFVVTLSNGATLDPVTLGVPAYATVMDVDAFIEEVCRGTAPDPLARAATLVQDLLALTFPILCHAHTAIVNANQGFEAAESLIEAAVRTVDECHLHEEADLNAAILLRNDIFAAAATVVTVSANIMINVLGELRDAGEISEEQFNTDVLTVSLNGFKLRVLRLGFRSHWFV